MFLLDLIAPLELQIAFALIPILGIATIVGLLVLIWKIIRR